MIKKFNLNAWNRMIVLTGIFSIIISSFVSALAVGGIENEVLMYPGQILQRGLSIQNLLAGDGAVSLEGKIEKGIGTASFSGSNKVSIPAGDYADIYLTLEVPANAVMGTKYLVKVVFYPTSVEEKGAGSVQYAIAVGKEFNIVVVEKPANVPAVEAKKTGISIWIWVLAIIVIIVIVWWILKKKK